MKWLALLLAITWTGGAAARDLPFERTDLWRSFLPPDELPFLDALRIGMPARQQRARPEHDKRTDDSDEIAVDSAAPRRAGVEQRR